MADQYDSTIPEREETSPLTRRSARESSRSSRDRTSKDVVAQRPVASAPAVANVSKERPQVGSGAGFRKPLRSVAILTLVGGLVASVAIPAYAAVSRSSEPVTVEQLAADNAQSFVAASDVAATGLSRSSYAATTAAEVETKKAAEAAAARITATAASSSVSVSSVNLSMVAPGSGAVRWPVDMSQITVGRGFGADGYHQGVDLLGAEGTPEFAAASGTVRVAGWYYGYGNAVVIDHVINGVSVSTLYGHMIQTLVSPGQQVSVGQIIGLMGSTGSSTANHLHFEVAINGGNVDPWAWLQANAG